MTAADAANANMEAKINFFMSSSCEFKTYKLTEEPGVPL